MRDYENAGRILAGKKVSAVFDDSDTAVITYYEEKLLIKDVTYLDYEMRIKKLVYNSNIITLKQLKESFAGNTYLETIVNDKDCLDWRILYDNNFLA